MGKILPIGLTVTFAIDVVTTSQLNEFVSSSIDTSSGVMQSNQSSSGCNSIYFTSESSLVINSTFNNSTLNKSKHEVINVTHGQHYEINNKDTSQPHVFEKTIINVQADTTSEGKPIFTGNLPIYLINSTLLVSGNVEVSFLRGLTMENGTIKLSVINGYCPEFRVIGNLILIGRCHIDTGSSKIHIQKENLGNNKVAIDITKLTKLIGNKVEFDGHNEVYLKYYDDAELTAKYTGKSDKIGLVFNNNQSASCIIKHPMEYIASKRNVLMNFLVGNIDAQNIYQLYTGLRVKLNSISVCDRKINVYNADHSIVRYVNRPSFNMSALKNVECDSYKIIGDYPLLKVYLTDNIQ